MSLADMAERAARLAKADLVTGMVGEFPELQGLMGGYYAAAQGEPREVADAIRDHYKPVGQGDDVPTAPVTVAVSLADKLDTLVSFFRAEQYPSGSKDPYALRRAALGCASLLADNGVRIKLSNFVEQWRLLRRTQQMKALHALPELAGIDLPEKVTMFGTQGSEGPNGEAFEMLNVNGETFGPFVAGTFAKSLAQFDMSKRTRPSDVALLDFFADRLKVQQREAGVRHDLIDAVFALGGEDDLVRLLARVHALQAFVTTDDGANLLAGYKRAANILKKEAYTPDTEGNPKTLSYTPEKAEADLIAALDSAEPAAAAAVAAEDFERAMAALASLRAPIDAFFDSVTVNDADPAKRTARLALLARVRAAVHTVADFSKIEG